MNVFCAREIFRYAYTVDRRTPPVITPFTVCLALLRCTMARSATLTAAAEGDAGSAVGVAVGADSLGDHVKRAPHRRHGP